MVGGFQKRSVVRRYSSSIRFTACLHFCFCTPVRASSRAYQNNKKDHERLHLEEARRYLQSAPVSDDGNSLSEKERNIVIARLVEKQTHYELESGPQKRQVFYLDLYPGNLTAWLGIDGNERASVQLRDNDLNKVQILLRATRADRFAG